MEKNEKYIEQKREYNSKLSSFQISKEKHKIIKDFCKEKKLKVKDFIEDSIIEAIKNY